MSLLFVLGGFLYDSCFFILGEGRVVSRGWAGGDSLGGLGHPFGFAVCRGHAQYPAFPSHILFCFVSSLPALAVKNLPANTGDIRDMGLIPWAGKIPWKWARHPCPVFFPGESQGQRNLVGCGPQGHKESDMTELT